MKERPTPETDAFFRSFMHGDATPSHAEYYDRMTKLERERDEARDTITDVLSALVAMEHEGPRLAALRVRGERDEAREWKHMLSGWGGTPELVHEFIKGQQARIHAVQDIERELEQAKQDAKQNELDCLRALGERNEARAEVQAIQYWATANGTIQMQREIDEMRKERDEAREQWRLSSVCRIFREQRDAAISIGLDAVGQLIDLHHTTSKRERNVEWECRADLLDRNFRKLEDLPDPQDFSCKPPNPA